MPNPTEGPTWLLAATWLPWSLVGEDPIFDVIAVIGLVAFGAFVWRNRSR